MININTLMIGNWVSYNGIPARVTSLDKDGKIGLEYVNYKVYGFSLEGVKLSQEILEKNGWEIEDACYAKYNLPDTYSSLEFYFHESRLRKWWEGVDEWDNHNKVRDITFQCHCSYAHELQNALTLCGLVEMAKGFEL